MRPEIESRQGQKLIPKPFILYTALMIWDKQQNLTILLNQEVSEIISEMSIVSTGSVKKGQAVTSSNYKRN